MQHVSAHVGIIIQDDISIDVDFRMALEPAGDVIATDSAAAKDDDLTINLCITDTGEHFFLKRTSGVLLVYPDAERENADSMLSCTRLQLLGLMMGSEEVMAAVHVDGDSTAPVRLVKYITPFSQTFNIVEP